MKFARIVAALTFIMIFAAPAHAQTTTTGPPASAGVSLVAQDSWVPLGGTFTMTLHLDDESLAVSRGAAIAVTVHESATTRSAFDGAINGGDLGGAIYQPNAIPVSSLTRDPRGDVRVMFGLPGSGVQPSIGIRRPGVYPVEVSLTNTGSPTTPFVTWLVTVDTSAAHPIDKRLMVSWIVPLVARPANVDNAVDPSVTRQLQLHGRLNRISQMFRRTGDVPLSLVLSPETMQTWQQLASSDKSAASGFAQVRTEANRPSTEVLPAPYVPIDATSLEAAGLGQHLPDEFIRGNNVLSSALGTRNAAPTTTAFIDPANSATVDRLRQMLVDRVVVRDAQLVPVTHPFTPAQTFTLTTTTGTARGAATAPFIEALLNGPENGAVKAARILASLSEVAYEQPALARGLVIAPSTYWTADLGTMNAVFAGLRHNPLLQAVTVDRLLRSVPPELQGQNGPPVERQLLNNQPAPMPVDAGEYERVSNEVDAYADMVGASDPTVTDARDRLAVALSTVITPEQAQAALQHADGVVHRLTDGITTDAKRITLTSRHARVPISFENKSQRTVTVRVHLDSPKLTFPNGTDETVTLPPGSTTKRIPMVARASGTFPLTITLTSEDGRLVLGAPARVTVRSAAFGGLAIGLTVAALLFLAVWWANHFRRTRKARRAAAPALT